MSDFTKFSYSKQDRLSTALDYARRGLAVFPLHTPLHDHPLGYRCTCEAYRHSDLCRERDAERRRRGLPPLYLAEGEHCQHPGKHPRGVKNWREESTTDAATIRQWWGKWPEANIGIDTGKSGLLVLDLDEYKDAYAGDSLLSERDEQTPTVLTGGGGQHLWYRLPPDKQWGNATGTLPAGIDIRGAGGFVVAPGSLHASGRTYEWELDYSLDDLPIADVPPALAAILDAAAKRCSYTTGRRWSGTPTTTAPDLDGLGISASLRELIDQAAPRGERSEIDMRLIVGLLYAGVDDDTIRAIFEHNPIGTAGKFAERGLDYLALTLDNAHRYVDAHPTKEMARRILAEVRRELREYDFADLVPVELQAANGYRSNETHRAVADAALSILHDYGKLEGTISINQLMERTARSWDTCKRAMACLTWLLEPGSKEGAKQAITYRLADRWRSCVHRDSLHNRGTEILSRCTQLPLATHAGHDAFVRSLTNITEDELQARIDARQERIDAGEDVKPIDRSRYRRQLAALIPSAGPAVLLAIDSITIHGAMTRAELGEKLFKKKSSISRLVQRGLFLGLLVERDDGVLDLADDWQALADTLAPVMPTAGTQAKRKLAALNSRQSYCQAALKNPSLSEEKRRALLRRHERAEKERQALAKSEAPDLACRAATVSVMGRASKVVPLTADIGIHTPNREGAADRLADAAYWNRLGKMTPAQRAWVMEANNA
jgi:hypothetical protein